ncbi:alpha/beta fold hydrolase [Desulfotomaculum sp. 1211_IL3151]|uniref:alpha/beta fold hydrolase n=1 Tax=Desulfotomaculum sp. 1211_IL3151 TaxID=3084055 RepID=UPI002FD94A1D
MINNSEIKSKRLHLNGIYVNCYTAGESGTPVILLHGAGVDSADISWGEIIVPLSKQHRVFAPDLPGYGKSDKPADVEYSMAFYVEILESLIESLNLTQICLIGLSLGGGISIAYTLKHPAQVEKLVLVGAYGLFKKLPYHLLSYWYTKTSLNELSYRLTAKSRKLVKWTLLYGLFGNPKNLSDELVEEIYQALKDPGAGKAFASFQRSDISSQGLRSNLAARLAEIKVPTLIVHGTKDYSVPVLYAQQAHQMIKGSQLYLMEGCKHWAQKERPEEFSQVVSTFLSS